MPTFSRSLEQSLHSALALANEHHHEYTTLEHLLLALIEDQDAAEVMRVQRRFEKAAPQCRRLS
jgi:ATP-dependent Clp protease ATP-binding subunit ClpA